MQRIGSVPQKLLFISLALNLFFIYYIQLIRTEEISKEQKTSTSTNIDSIVINKIRKSDINSKATLFPEPNTKLKDSIDEFFVDQGTYEPPVSNSRKTNVLILPNKCEKNINLAIGIKTTVTNKDKRRAIRETWGNSEHYKLHPSKLIFLVGIDTNLGKDTSFILLKDEKKFEDILFGDFDDSFHNLTYKDSMFFTWTKYGCESAKHVLKGDDDILINPFELQKFLNTENKTEPVVYGCMLANQPVQKQGVKYGDKIWPEEKYPKYVSGGGFIMNSIAMLKVQEMIKITPIIPIDDAFIGICLRRAGLENNIIKHEKFKSWGFRPFDEKKFNVCEIDKIIYFHKFSPDEIDCFWPKFMENRDKCQNVSYKYEEKLPFCNPRDWHLNHAVAPPILDGKNYHHCGPTWGNAGCSVKPEDWQIRNPHNGPCCSPNGYCGITKDHCKCNDCVDFRVINKANNVIEAHSRGVCCEKLLVTSRMSYSGTYALKMDSKGNIINDNDGNVVYDCVSNEKGFKIEHGGFSVYGTGWYILAKEGGGLSWYTKDSHKCPPIGNWDGYGSAVSCLT